MTDHIVVTMRRTECFISYSLSDGDVLAVGGGEDVKTSIDVIPLLIEKLLKREQEEAVTW